MSGALTHLRDQIDEVDKSLLSLLAKRLQLSGGSREVKSQHGLPVYAPDREAAMLASRRQEAESLGVPPDLIEDVLRRIMRESYSRENDKGFKKLNEQARPIVIVGGDGKMGQLFRRMLTLSGYTVRILDSGDWADAPELLADAGMVIVSVPIHLTEQVIKQLPPLPEDCILADLASVKAGPLQAMLAVHNGPVLGLHPMFGPDVGSFAKQVVAFVTDVSRSGISGSWSKLQSGARIYRVLRRRSMIAICATFRRCVTSLPLLTGGIWQRKCRSRAAAVIVLTDLPAGTGHDWSSVCPGSAALCRYHYGFGR